MSSNWQKTPRPFPDHNEIASSIIDTYEDRFTEKGIELSGFRQDGTEYREQKGKLDKLRLQYLAYKAKFEQDDSARFMRSRQIIRIAQAIFHDDPVMQGILAQFRRKDPRRKAQQRPAPEATMPPPAHTATALPEAIAAGPGNPLPVARA